MNLKIAVVLFCIILSVILIIQLISGKKGASAEKPKVIYLHMDSNNKQLIVSEKKGNLVGKKIDKIYFNENDYTQYIIDLLAKYPLSFASHNFLIFGAEKAVFQGDELLCREGILFVPQEQKISFIAATDIIFNESKQVIRLKNARVEELSLPDNKKIEKKISRLNIDLNNL